MSLCLRSSSSQYLNILLFHPHSSQASRYGRNSSSSHYKRTHHQMTDTILFFMYMFKRIHDLTFSLKSPPDRYGALKGFLECLPLSKSATLRQSNNLSNIVTNRVVSSTLSFPVSRRAVATVPVRNKDASHNTPSMLHVLIAVQK